MLFLVFYSIFTIWGTFYFKDFSFSSIIGDFITVIIFTWLLNYLCSTNHESISWMIFLIFIAISITTIYFIKRLNITNSDLEEQNSERLMQKIESKKLI